METPSTSVNSAGGWDERYRRGEHRNDAPHPFVVQCAAELVPGAALDLACGPGRHALWLAGHGWHVTAVDRSAEAIRILEEQASSNNVSVRCRIADLERGEFVIEPEAYDLIVVCNYLQRDLFPTIRAGVRPGGTVIAVIPLVDENPEVKPMSPAYLLQPGELPAQFGGWNIVRCREGKVRSDRRAAAEMAAVRVR
jgi:SAM-dependent methyltransferase